MPNDSSSACGCGVALELPKSRNNMAAVSKRNFAMLIPKCGSRSSNNKNKHESRSTKKPVESESQQQTRSHNSNNRISETGPSSIPEQSNRPSKSNKKDKRTQPRRRARSAERAESHYTYIDSSSSTVSSSRGSNLISEALYCTIDGDDDETEQQQSVPTTATTTNGISNGLSSNTQQQQHQQSSNSTVNGRPQQPLYAIPSMTSPPPTYDVAIAKSWQTGLPPSYEEYLCHKRGLLTRSHTPPPPWSDSASLMSNGSGSGGAGSLDLRQISQELLANEPELREYLTQLALHGGAEQALREYHHFVSQQQALRKQAARANRTRAMPPRSQSESRAQQQRIAYEDFGAFCMETTAIQSAFENGATFCSLM
ncbi:hypothetical protein QAD02_019323 [Eretmocerus hayati]|uniref:Uncharacterized protein n=1 Tax=Eretmocerus hayati TaxID=131215 RepID=A0ACC2PL41_9HYME|nr:hypothetical protein QAD02_019323 [Eretmocerus hayati]